MVRLEGLEPPRTGRQILSLVRLPIPPQPHFNMEATSRFELEMKELQSSALPLGYVAILLIFWFSGVSNGIRTHGLQSHNLAL